MNCFINQSLLEANGTLHPAFPTVSILDCATKIATEQLSLVMFPFLLFVCSIGNFMNIFVISRFDDIHIKECLLISLSFTDVLAM